MNEKIKRYFHVAKSSLGRFYSKINSVFAIRISAKSAFICFQTGGFRPLRGDKAKLFTFCFHSQ